MTKKLPDDLGNDFMSNDYAHQVARQSGSNFYFSFFSLPKPQREAITAVYAFCREVDDAVDQPQEKNPGNVIARWRDEINRTYDNKPTLPLTQSLLKAIDGFQLSKGYFDGILDGVAMDLRMDRYPTFEALTAYCYHVAGEVGLLCMEIFGYRSERLKSYAIKLGTAFQLTNILRDIRSDAARGRIYIPQDDMARFGVAESDVLEGRFTPSFQRLMSYEARRARGYYHEASVLPLPGERPSLRAAELMRAIYEDVLKRIEKCNYNVFAKRIRVPTAVKIGLALKTWWECRR
jgi:phytoene synthase